MKKLILHSIGNNGNYNFYVFDKKKSVVENLSTLFSDIFEINWNFEINYKKINRRTDLNECVSDVHDRRIYIFYGDKKMFVTIICSEKSRLKFNDALLKYFTMPKYKFRKNVKKNKNMDETIGPFRHTKLK